MAEASDKLKDTTSHPAMGHMLGWGMMTTPLPLAMLEMTHEGRVLKDGLTTGTAGLISSIVGLPRDLYEFGRERIKGEKRATPEKERIMSSEWIEDKLMAGYEISHKFQFGYGRPEIREDSFDGAIHATGKLVPLVGSFFIPGVGEAKLASLGSKLGTVGEKAGAVLGKTGVQLGVVDLGKTGVEYGEKFAGVERPTESPEVASTSFAALSAPAQGFTSTAFVTPAATKTPVATQNFAAASGGRFASGKVTVPIQSSPVMAAILSGNLTDKENPQSFNAAKVKEIQTIIIGDKRIKDASGDDGVFGSKTARTIDTIIKRDVPQNMISDADKAAQMPRLKELAADLKTKPADSYSFDPRVLEFQTRAYIVGLYDKGLDGLAGTATDKALKDMTKTTEIMAKVTTAPVQANAPTPKEPAPA
ncbi:MAG: hypothetical protein WC043_05110 [Pseudobdellovibrionaceae bacterium]